MATTGLLYHVRHHGLERLYHFYPELTHLEQGGIVIIYKSNLNLSISQISSDTDKYKQFENAYVTDFNKTFCLIAINRPYQSQKNGFTQPNFSMSMTVSFVTLHFCLVSL